MSVVTSSVSPLNCRWIVWQAEGPVCTRNPDAPRPVSEWECSICEHWTDEAERHAPSATLIASDRVVKATTGKEEAPPTPPEVCPSCGSTAIRRLQSDALVRACVCRVCHTRWLASEPWHDGGT